MKTLLLSFYLIFFAIYADRKSNSTDPCKDSNEITLSQIPSHSQSTVQKKVGISDGNYFTGVISFNDNIRGSLFQGSASQKYFIEDPIGKNYYYKDKDYAIRALYIYKKNGCMSTVGKN